MVVVVSFGTRRGRGERSTRVVGERNPVRQSVVAQGSESGGAGQPQEEFSNRTVRSRHTHKTSKQASNEGQQRGPGAVLHGGPTLLVGGLVGNKGECCFAIGMNDGNNPTWCLRMGAAGPPNGMFWLAHFPVMAPKIGPVVRGRVHPTDSHELRYGQVRPAPNGVFCKCSSMSVTIVVTVK